jgi:hypothetical protein
MAGENPDDLLNQLKNVDKTICGVCKKKLVGPSFLGNVDGKVVSLCSTCRYIWSKKKK